MLAILASSLTLTCLSLIKSNLYPKSCHFRISETSVEFVIFFLFLQPQLLHRFTCLQQTRLLQFPLLWHLDKQRSQQTSTHSKFIGTCHYKHFKISTHHTNTQKTTLWTSYQTKNWLHKSVFSHTKHLQINNLHISTIVFHFRHILFLHDLLIHLFSPFHMSDHHLARRAFSVIGPRLWNSFPPDTRNSSSLPIFRIQAQNTPFQNCVRLPRHFPISLDCLPGFWFLLFSFYALSNDT